MLRNLFKRKKDSEDEDFQEGSEQDSESAQPALEPEEVPVDKPIVQPSDEAPEEKRGWFSRLKTGLARTRDSFAGRISSLIGAGRKIDEELMEEIEEILIQADVGINTTLELMDNVRETVQSRRLNDSAQLEDVIKEEVINILGEDGPLNTESAQPYTILILGVNGAGKTTTIGKLAHRFKLEGKRVLVAAGDTFRAAAADQLAVWCDRAGVQLVRSGEGSDPAAVVFDAVEAAKSRESDVLIVDTAGRLHTKKPLMDELSKIGRVMGRGIPGAPHEVLLVIDGTAGQNAIMQAKIFNEAVSITGVAVTKLDGTAKGGVVIAVKGEIGAPVRLIGIGEQLDDLRDFVAKDFVEALFTQEDTTAD